MMVVAKMVPPQNGICLANSHHHGDIAAAEISNMYPAACGEVPGEACFLSFFDLHGLQEPQYHAAPAGQCKA